MGPPNVFSEPLNQPPLPIAAAPPPSPEEGAGTGTSGCRLKVNSDSNVRVRRWSLERSVRAWEQGGRVKSLEVIAAIPSGGCACMKPKLKGGV